MTTQTTRYTSPITSPSLGRPRLARLTRPADTPGGVATLAAALGILCATVAPSGALASGLAARAATTSRSALAAARATASVQPAHMRPAAALPLAFEPNRGQAAPGATFLARGPGYNVALGATGATLTLDGRATRSAAGPSHLRHTDRAMPAGRAARAAVTVSLVGGNRAASGQGQGTLPGTVSYLLGRDPAGWLTRIPTYAAVRYAAVYRGIDLVYYGDGPRLEYDFRVAPGADPRQIRLAFRGVARPILSADGDLILCTPAGEIRQRRPVIYQLVHGARRQVAGGYVRAGDTIGIRVGAYDPRAPLVIDPVVVYATYDGGAGEDRGNAVAVDGAGNVYVAGATTSVYGAQAAFVSKFDPTGTQVLWTQIISNHDPNNPNKPTCNAQGNGIAVDGRGNVDVAGAYDDAGSYSWNNNLCQNEGVLWASFDPSGAALGEQVYSASGTINRNGGTAIAADGQGNTYLTGQTDQRPNNFPVTPGAFQTTAGIDKASGGVAGDAFVLKVDPTGSVVYGTYLGGSSIDKGLSIAVDGHGNAVVGGTTQSADFPATANAYQPAMSATPVNAFVSELSADGSALLYSTFLGARNGATTNGVAVDAQGAIYATGATDAPDFPTTPNAYSRSCGGNGTCSAVESCYFDWSSGQNECHIYNAEDAFVLKIDPTQSGAASLVYSTFLGGLNRDLGTAIAVGADGAAYVAGRTASGDFPVRQASQPAFGGAWNAFVAKVDPTKAGDASLVWSTYLGGGGYDEADGLALDVGGNVYVTGFTTSTDFPTQNPAQGANGGNADAFVAKLGPTAPATLAALTLDRSALTGGGSATGTVTLTGPAPAGGASVALTSSAPDVASVPTTVAVPAGATAATFTVATRAVAAPTGVTLSASYNGGQASAALSLTPPAVPATNTPAPPTSTNTPLPSMATPTDTVAPPAATATLTTPPTATGTATPPSNSSGGGTTTPSKTRGLPAPPAAATATPAGAPTSAPPAGGGAPSPAAGGATPPASSSGPRPGDPTATPAPWKPDYPHPRRDDLPLGLSLRHATLPAGGTLTLVVTTAANARVDACLAATTTRVTWTGTGTHRARHVAHVQVCRATQRGQADRHGRFVVRLRAGAVWPASAQVTLTVRARAGSRATTRAIPVSIRARWASTSRHR